MQKKEKCITCKHPLGDHYGEYCMHYHHDIRRRCRCAQGSDGAPGGKKFLDKPVVSVVLAGDNFVWFVDDKGNHWRWMYSYKSLFPVSV